MFADNIKLNKIKTDAASFKEALATILLRPVREVFKPAPQVSGVTAFYIADDQHVSVARVVISSQGKPVVIQCASSTEAENNAISAMGKMVLKLGLLNTKCRFLLNINDYEMHLTDVPSGTLAEKKTAAKWQARELIDYPIDDAIVDSFEVPGREQDQAGEEELMYTFVAPLTIIKTSMDAMQDFGVKLQSIGIMEIALRNLAALVDENESGTAFIHFSQNSTLLILVRLSSIHLVRRSPVGIASIREVLAEHANNNASGLSLDNEYVEHNNKLDAVILEVQRSFDYYERHTNNPAIRNIYITPQQDMEGVEEYFSNSLGVDVHMLNMDKIIESEEGIDADALSASCLAIGAALQGSLEEVH